MTTSANLNKEISKQLANSVETATIDMGVRVQKAIAKYEAECLKIQEKIARLEEYKTQLVDDVTGGRIKLASEVTNSINLGEQQGSIASLIS